MCPINYRTQKNGFGTDSLIDDTQKGSERQREQEMLQTKKKTLQIRLRSLRNYPLNRNYRRLFIGNERLFQQTLCDSLTTRVNFVETYAHVHILYGFSNVSLKQSSAFTYSLTL